MTSKNNINPDEMLPTVEKMLFNLAWKCANAYPVTFEEARSEAYYAFMCACRDYDPTRGSKFSTWCYFWTWTHLKTFITKRTVDPLSFFDIDEELVGAAPPQRSESLDMIEDLSEDAREIIALIIETPHEILRGTPIPAKHLLTRVKAYLVAKRGKDRRKLDQASEEIKIRFRAAWAN